MDKLIDVLQDEIFGGMMSRREIEGMVEQAIKDSGKDRDEAIGILYESFTGRKMEAA